MALVPTLNPSSLLLSSRNPNSFSFKLSPLKLLPRPRSLPPMATLSIAPALGLSKTFERLKEQGRVAFIPYITAGDPDMSTTSMALKVLDSCGSDIIELGMPYSDPLADGPVIQAAATRALAKGTNFDAIITMLRETIPQISSPIALFSYYNPILKRGAERFMSTIEDVGVRGLVVPDVPLEETQILRNEAAKHNIELVLLTTPTTPTERMRAIVKASEGFVYLVSSIGVTGARASVSSRVQSLLQDIKEIPDFGRRRQNQQPKITLTFMSSRISFETPITGHPALQTQLHSRSPFLSAREDLAAFCKFDINL